MRENKIRVGNPKLGERSKKREELFSSFLQIHKLARAHIKRKR
jgi:hypothetical protein